MAGDTVSRSFGRRKAHQAFQRRRRGDHLLTLDSVFVEQSARVRRRLASDGVSLAVFLARNDHMTPGQVLTETVIERRA